MLLAGSTERRSPTHPLLRNPRLGKDWLRRDFYRRCFDELIGRKTPSSVPTRTEYSFMDRAYHVSRSRIHLAVPADSRMADTLFREVPEDEEENEEEQGEDEEE